MEVGRHGLRIHRGESSGLLLPTVAVEHGWDSEALLRHVCRKAGLPTTAWEDDETQLLTFESSEFGGPFDTSVLDNGAAAPAASPVGPAELHQLAWHARNNIVALVQGMAPNYYLFGVPDGSVTGLALTVSVGEAVEPVLYSAESSLRPGLPLQATLLRLCEQSAAALRPMGVAPQSIRVGLLVLSDPALHGTFAAPDLRGFNPAQRALIALDQDQSAWLFSPRRPIDDLVATVRTGGPGAPSRNRDAAQPGSAVDGGGGRRPVVPPARARACHPASSRGRSVLSRRGGRAQPAGRQPARRQRAATREVGGGHGPACGPYLLGPTRGFGAEPLEDPRAGDRRWVPSTPARGSACPSRRTRHGRSPARRFPRIPSSLVPWLPPAPASSSTPPRTSTSMRSRSSCRSWPGWHPQPASWAWPSAAATGSTAASSPTRWRTSSAASRAAPAAHFQ